MDEATLKERVRAARGKFAAMAATYTFGTFNDNFFKQAVMLLALRAGQGEIQGHATVIFCLPYLVFAGHAGWMSDRFPKQRIVIGAKALELAAMIVGAIAICTGNMTLVLVMLGLMGTWAAFFSPALNGSIPELYPAEYVPTANAVVKASTTAAILLGIATAGVALDLKGPDIGGVPFGKTAVAATVIGVALFGLLASLWVPFRPAAAPKAPFPWSGPFDAIRELWRIRLDFALTTIILLDSFVWFAGSTQALLINKMGVDQLKVSDTKTSGLLAAELIGIAVGGVIAAKLARRHDWKGLLGPATIGMGALMLVMSVLPHIHGAGQYAAIAAAIGCIGVCGGLALIPCESFIQVRPAPEKKGAVIAAGNFAAFAAILLSGPVANALNYNMLPTTSFAIIGAAGVAAGIAVMMVKGRMRTEG